MTYVLLGLAAVLATITVYVGLFMKHTPDPTPPDVGGRTEEQEVVDRARGLMKSNAFTLACDLMRTYVLAHPRDVVVRQVLAEAEWKADRPDQAERTIAELEALAKLSAAMLWLRGELARQREFRAYGLSVASAVWAVGEPIPPRTHSTHMRFFRQAAESGVGAGAETWLKYGLELLAADEVDLADKGMRDLIGRKEKVAEEYLDKALDAGLQDVRVLDSLGWLALKGRNFERAVVMLSEAVRRNPDEHRLWAMLAEAQKQAGQFDPAVKSVAKALALHRAKTTLVLKGQIHRLRREYLPAAEAYAEAAEDPRLRPTAAQEAAECYYRLEKHALAMKYVDIAAGIDPGNPQVQKLLQEIEDARFGPVAGSRKPTSPPSPKGPSTSPSTPPPDPRFKLPFE